MPDEPWMTLLVPEGGALAAHLPDVVAATDAVLFTAPVDDSGKIDPGGIGPVIHTTATLDDFLGAEDAIHLAVSDVDADRVVVTIDAATSLSLEQIQAALELGERLGQPIIVAVLRDG